MGNEIIVLNKKIFKISKKFNPIFVFTRIIPVSDMKTSCVKASTPIKNLDASDGESVMNKAGKYISAKPAREAGAICLATSVLYPIKS